MYKWFVYQKYSICNVGLGSQLGLQRSNVIHEQLFLLSYTTGRTVVWCWARHVSDSYVSCLNNCNSFPESNNNKGKV